jgi:hypothetical protein
MVLPKRCYEIRLTEMEWLRNKFFCFKDDDISRLMKIVLMKIYELTNGLINFVSFLRAEYLLRAEPLHSVTRFYVYWDYLPDY